MGVVMSNLPYGPLQVELVDVPDASVVREAAPESRSILDDIISRLESSSDDAVFVSTIVS